MRFKINKNAALLIAAAVLCVALSTALIYSVTVIRGKNREIVSGRERIAENESRISELESEIAAEEKANSDTASRLGDAENERKRLEEENSRLNSEIETLKKKRQTEAEKQLSVQARQPDGRHVCYLTFDDGPSDNTLEILEILRKYGIKATFFVIESEKFDYIKNINDAGHTVGLHSATHNYSKIYSGINEYFNDLNHLADRVEQTIGKRPTVMRFPGGSSNQVSRKYCGGIMTKLVSMVGEKGYSYFDWNVSSGDAQSAAPSYTYIRNNVLNGAADKNSACVLMHDSADKTTTVKALPEIIEGLMKMGYSFEPLSSESYGYHHRNLNN